MSGAGALTTMADNLRVLRRNPALTWLLPGLFVSSLGTGMSSVGVAWLALVMAPPGTAGLWVAAALAALYLPGTAGGFLLQRVLGGLSGRAVLVLDGCVRGTFFAAIAFCAWSGVLGPVLYIGLLVGASVTAAWARGGLHALIAATVGPDERLAANSWLMAQSSVASTVGPALGGLVTASVGAASIFVLDAVSLFVLAAVVASPQVGRGTAPASPPRGEVVQRGWGAIRANPAVLRLLLLTFGVGFFFGLFEVALPLHSADTYEAGAAGLGLLWSLFGAGAAAGAFLSVYYGRVAVWTAAVGTTLLWALAVGAVGLAPVLALAGLAMFTAGLVYAPYQTVASTFVQSSFTPAQLPSVGAAWAAILLVATPAGYFLGGPLVQVAGARSVVLISAGATVVVGLVAAGSGLLPSRRRAAPPTETSVV